MNNFCIDLKTSKSDFETYITWLCEKYYCSKFELARKESEGKLKKDDGQNYVKCKIIIKWIDYEVEMIKQFSLDDCTESSYEEIFSYYEKEVEEFFTTNTLWELFEMNDVLFE